MAEYIIKDKVEWYKCKADITIGDKDFGNTGIMVIPVADISELPTIDIVTCSECIHSEKLTDFCMVCDILYEWHGECKEVKPNWFCADGERKSALKHADEETLQSAT